MPFFGLIWNLRHDPKLTDTIAGKGERQYSLANLYQKRQKLPTGILPLRVLE
ncbi:hypothetical protein COO91_01112 [Nostoc flagelliforme CCNUN1]|uniref:Uncharacterized protein n=1 Tax=Nostoc flagelliforme CCNUN1 TaxID=2038116 RepID=A0A2K8SII4_9NOSO|nr:hypothetical protein COO91_01112 [Nostoc flagelliforme CCNUN1]